MQEARSCSGLQDNVALRTRTVSPACIPQWLSSRDSKNDREDALRQDGQLNIRGGGKQDFVQFTKS